MADQTPASKTEATPATRGFRTRCLVRLGGADYAAGEKIALDRAAFDELSAAGAIDGSWPTKEPKGDPAPES